MPPIANGLINGVRLTISRVAGSVTFPSEFMLVAAMNPCPCRYFGDLKSECRCGPLQVQRYRQRISGPLLDRIDLHIEGGSAAIRDRVGRADGSRQIKQHCKLSDESQELIRVAMTELNLSARAYNRILKVSRTVADLPASEAITPEQRQRSHPISDLRPDVVGLTEN